MTLTIDRASSSDIPTVRTLFVEYAASLGFSLDYQNFDDELAALPGAYAAPRGSLLLARVDGAPAGVVAMKELEAGVCEMKRLYVRPGHRGHRIGRGLVERLIDEARVSGYTAMRLDTVEREMGAAIALYESLGFERVAPYYEGAIEGTVFMEVRV